MSPIAAGCRLLLTSVAAVATSALLATPALAAKAPAPLTGSVCPPTAVTQPFAPWGDGADYFLAPGGSIDDDSKDWTLRGGAGVVKGNEPFHVVSPKDKKALRLPAGSSATTAPFCIDASHQTMRFFADAGSSSSLDVDVLYSDADGARRSLRIGALSGGGAWAPTDVVPMVVNAMAESRGAFDVQLRFAPREGDWTIDDVHVDPYRIR